MKSVELYSPNSNLWATLAPMKEARGRFDIAVANGKVYAVGGSNGTNELATVEMYDPLVLKWIRVAALPLARSNAGELCQSTMRSPGLTEQRTQKLARKQKISVFLKAKCD